MVAFFAWAFLVNLALLPGCKANKARQQMPYSPPPPTFASHFEELRATTSLVEPEAIEEKRISISTNGMPLVEFLRWLTNETGVSCVAEAAIDSKPVTVELQDQTVDETLGVVARRVGVQVTRSGNLYFLGSLRREDRGVMVRRVRRLDGEQVRNAVSTLLSEFGQIAAFEDGLVIVGDRVEVLTRVNDLLNQVEAAESPCWCVQLYLLNMTDTDVSDFGVDIAPAAEVGLAFANASNGGFALSPKANVTLDALLRSARNRGSETMLAEPMMYMVDGSEGKCSRVDRIPIPRKALVGQNASSVETVGYDFVDAGFTLTIKLREISQDEARLSCVVDLSTITGYVEDSIPKTSVEHHEGIGNVRSGGAALIRSFPREVRSVNSSHGLRFGSGENFERRLLQIYCRAYRAGVPAVPVAIGGSETVDFQQTSAQ